MLELATMNNPAHTLDEAVILPELAAAQTKIVDRTVSRKLHKDPRTMAYFDKRRAEGLSDRDIVRCLKRHVANEVFALLTRPEISTPQGPLLRQQRQVLHLATTEVVIHLGVLYQRLRRLEMGERSDAELQHA